MEALKVEKSNIRERVNSVREEIGNQPFSRYAPQISEHILRLPQLCKVQTVALYSSTEFEVDIQPLFARLQSQSIKTCFPRVSNKTNRTMNFHLVEQLEDLESGFANITEPKTSAPLISHQDIDCICVPGLAFDKTGARLGRGAGYYDKWLKKYSGLRIGITLHNFIFTNLPTNEHDERMDIIVTEQGAIFCREVANN